MWLDRLFSTVSYIEKPVFCEKHESVKNMSEEVKKQCQEIFCVLAYIRKRVIDPFYYKTPYPSTVIGEWCANIEKLPWNSSMAWDQLEEDKDLVHLAHDIATYTLAALTRICVLCEKSKNILSNWVSNTKEDTDLWHRLRENSADFKKALSCSSQYQKILDEIYSLQSLPSENIQFVDTVFFITFMIRYSVFSSESAESILASNKKIMEHTKKFTLEFPIGENHLQALEPLSQQLATLKSAEKESFNILLELVKKAATSLRFKKYKAAEVYSHAIVALVPSWSKGYFFLASAVYHSGKETHYAHEVASHGIAICDKTECSSCATFRQLIQKWQQECGPMCHAPTANKLVIDEFNRIGDYKRVLSEVSQKKLISEADDVPELTDPSSSEESGLDESESDLDSDEGGEKSEKLEVTQSHPVPDIKQVKPDEEGEKGEKLEVSKSHPVPEVKQVKPGCNSERNHSPVKKQSPVKKHPNSQQSEGTKSQPNPVQDVDTKPTKTNPKKVEKTRQRKESANDSLSVVEVQEKMERLRILLKEGSAAIIDGCGLSAVRNFNDALSELKSNPNIYEFEEYEIVCIKYAYGSACIKSGTYEDLNKAIAVFSEILNDHPNVRFPVAYYGLGLVHFKLNAFKESLSHFEMLQSILNKGIHCTVYSWPGTVHAIDETKTEKLKVILNDLIEKCQSPPDPAAICRYENCASRPEIYYSDPDFKGFTIIQCQDRCVLQYHPSCWKSLKDSFDRTDKDFLGQQCLTPDCEFIVMQIECIGKDGTSEKHFEIEDPEKVKKHKKSRLEKRLVMKEQKKKRRLESLSVSVPENPDVCDNSEVASETASNVSDQPAVKDLENHETIESEPTKKVESNLSVNAKPFYVKKDGEPLRENTKACYMWKKDADSLCENEKVSKTKERKKAKKPAALSLEEFRQKIQDFSYYNEYQMRLDRLQQNQNIVEDRQVQWSTICETEKIPHLDPNRPFYIPEDLRDDPLALDAVLQSYSSFGKTDFSRLLKEKIYVHMEKILSFYGPMRADDSVLLEVIAGFPSSFQKMISDAGGLKDFLLSSMRFAFVGDHICIVSDVVKAYSLGSKSFNGEGYSSAYDRLEEYEASNGALDEDEFHGENNEFRSRLNPHAVEYNPYSPVQSKGSSSGNSNCSSETYQNDVGVKEVDQESPIGSSSTLFSSSAKPLQTNGQNFSSLTKNNEAVCVPGLNSNSDTKCDSTVDDSYLFADPDQAFQQLGKDMKKIPRDKKFDMFLKILKFVLNDDYYAEFISSYGHHLKPYAFTVIPKKQNKCLQAGTPDINMRSIGVMKDDDHVKAIIENFHDLERFRNNINEEKKIVEEKLEHALDTAAQLQNALIVAEKNAEKKVEEVQAVLEEEKKEFRKKEKNWEKEQKRLELNQARMTEQLKGCKEEIKVYKELVMTKDALLKEAEELKKATELDLENVSKAKIEIETSLHEALHFHEVEATGLAKKLQNAQLEILTIKKNYVLEKISEATKSAESRLKEIQDGLPLVHPMILEKFKTLQAQIKEHIVKLGKMHCDFVKSANEQIEELKKGKDMSDLEPLVEPNLPECPTLNVPQQPTTNVGQNPRSLSPGNSSSQTLSDIRSLGFMMQAPNSTAVPSSSPVFGPLLNSFSQKLATPQVANVSGAPVLGNLPGLTGSNVSGASILGNFPGLSGSKVANVSGASILGNFPGLSGSNVSSIKPYPIQKTNAVNSYSLFDTPIYSNAVPGYIQKPVSSFQQDLPRAHIPPGLSTPIHPSSQEVSNSSASQGSSMFRLPHNLQQNSSGNQPLVQTPFSFGFPQFPSKPESNASGKTASKNSEKPATAEISVVNTVKNGVSKTERQSSVDSETHSKKNDSKESSYEIKSKISDISAIESIPPPVGKVSRTNSTCSSPVPLESSSRDNKSVNSDSSRSTPVTVPELPVKASPLFLDDLETTGVKIKTPKVTTKQRKTSVSSRSGASSVASDYDPFNLDGSVPESSALELGYTVKEHNDEASRAKVLPPPSSSNAVGFSRAVKAPSAKPKDVPTTNSYEKLLAKLMTAYPQSSREELIFCVGEFRRSHNNKLSNLKFGSIISGIGELLEKRKSNLTQVGQAPPKKKPQLQVVSLTKKPAAPPPPVTEKSGACPWAKPEFANSSTPWHGNSSDTSCVICLEEMTLKSSVQKLECGHRFHTMCLKEWLGKNSNCPICRVHVLLPEDYPSLS